MTVTTLYENKAHQRTCGLRYIPRESLKAQRNTYRAGEPPHCTCIKPISALVRHHQRWLASNVRSAQPVEGSAPSNEEG